MGEVISVASSPAAFDAFGALIREYVGWCRVRHADHPWLIDMVFGEQSLDRELSDLASAYAAPHGKILLAECDGQLAGGLAYRTLGAGICEMKRLFVREPFMRRGLGTRLCQALIGHARIDGFRMMRLDTSILLEEAQRLYRSLGFVPCAPYNDYPQPLRSFIVHMEMPLSVARE
jgi:GNAT superfamily N-acetyltransferase